MKTRILFIALALLLVLEPFALYAQGAAGYGSGYGQAVGARRQMNRNISTPGRTGSFYEQGNGSFSSSEEMGSMMGRSSGSSAEMMGSTYQIHVLGHVFQPGTYRLPPSTRLDEAINMAGGLKKQGSERRVELRRGGSVQRFDLLRYREAGDLNQNPFLLDNDVVFIPFSEKNIAIQGPVKSPGTYELISQDPSLWNVVELAGGFTTGVSLDSPVTIVRYIEGKKQLLEVPNVEQSLKEFPILNGDVVAVPHIFTEDRKFDYNVSELPADNLFIPAFNDNVFVMGAVQLPGAYTFNPHYSIRDFVAMAGPVQHARFGGIHVLTPNGKRVAHPDRKGFKLSPGDTIVVPQRAWTADNVIKWYNTFANTVITGFTLRELIRR